MFEHRRRSALHRSRRRSFFSIARRQVGQFLEASDQRLDTVRCNCNESPIMKRLRRNAGALLTVLALVIAPIQAPAQTQETEVELVSTGGLNTYQLPDGVSQVELTQQIRGGCRFGRSWGYDLSSKELWVNSGCGGRFQITRTLQDSSHSSGSNAGYVVAAVAAVAGIALLANSHRHDDNRGNGAPGAPPGAPSGAFRGVGGLCLDVDKGRGPIRPGAAVQIWSCHGRENQRFFWGRNGQISSGGLCLDIENANRNDGAKLIVWPCSGAPNQRWRARGSNIVSDLNGKCMVVWEGREQRGQRVVTWGCNGSPNQRWWW
jgi:hypothetical protein